MENKEEKVCPVSGRMCYETCGSCHYLSELYTSSLWEGVGKCYVYGNYKKATDEACDHYMEKR